MNVTEEEMISAKLPHDTRGYCAEYLIKHHVCRRDQFPLVYRCAHERHEYQNCTYEE